MHKFKLTLLATLLLDSTVRLGAQTDSSPKSAKAKEWQAYFARLEDLKKTGRAAYSDEDKREKAGDCPKAVTTYDINVCLGDEVGKTTANLKTYTDALRAMEGLSSPGEDDANGPTGASLSREMNA